MWLSRSGTLPAMYYCEFSYFCAPEAISNVDSLVIEAVLVLRVCFLATRASAFVAMPEQLVSFFLRNLFCFPIYLILLRAYF